MPKRLITSAALFALLAVLSLATATDAIACKKCAKHNTAAEAKEAPKHNVAPEGFTALFNGKDIDGWVKKSGFCEYTVKDGIITGHTAKGSGNTFLTTAKEYGDFELKFDVLLHDNGLNSGVQIRSKVVKDADNEWGGRLGGPQCEIEAGPGQSGYIYGEATGKGWLSPEPKSKDKKVNSHEHFMNGEWNSYHIIAKGNNIKTFINGHPVADLTVTDDIQEKFAKGVIGLQVHSVKGDPKWSVSWRNIYIKELSE